MRLLILTIISLLLSTVVPVTDSCMSWRRTDEHILTTSTTIEQPTLPSVNSPTTTYSDDSAADFTERAPPIVTIYNESVDQESANENTAVKAKMPLPQNSAEGKTVIVIEGPWVHNITKRLKGSHDEPCEESFGKEFCLNDGACFIEQTIDGKRAHCVCKQPFSGERCMHKDPDEMYRPEEHHHHHQQHDHKHRQSTDVAIPITPPVRDIRKETININGVPCPNEPQYEFFCGGVGKCFMIIFSDRDNDFIIGCECDDPYYGLRCEEKRLDGFYGSGIIAYNNGHMREGGRKRRSIDVNKMRRNENRRFHAGKLLD